MDHDGNPFFENCVYGMRWDLVVLGAPPAPSGEIEHAVVLPAQPRGHVRVLRGAVRRVTRPWAGLAFSDEDCDRRIPYPRDICDECEQHQNPEPTPAPTSEGCDA